VCVRGVRRHWAGALSSFAPDGSQLHHMSTVIGGYGGRFAARRKPAGLLGDVGFVVEDGGADEVCVVANGILVLEDYEVAVFWRQAVFDS
jgi:hypothetical protein